MAKHPQQPLEVVNNVVRFKSNPLVKALVSEFPGGLNKLSTLSQNMEIDVGHWRQILQLIGYRICGYCDYESVTEEECNSLEKQVDEILKNHKK